MSSRELWGATKKKYAVQFGAVQTMQVKKKRHIFGILRQQEEMDTNIFMPLYGLHLGEFAFFQILSEQLRKDTREKNGSLVRPQDSPPESSRGKGLRDEEVLHCSEDQPL
jgi:hypothetical protein